MSGPHIARRLLLVTTLVASVSAGGSAVAQTKLLEQQLRPLGVVVSRATFKGKPAIHVITTPEGDAKWEANPIGSGGGIVIVPGTDIRDGVVEVDIASRPKPGASADARGFAGLAFHVNEEGTTQEHVYMRPTNGRADDQLRRNHSVQYAMTPGAEWQILRRDFPGKYETYADLEPNEWMHMKLEISGEKVRVYMNHAAQPTLIVNDAKLPTQTGKVALWIGVGAEAHFANLSVRPTTK